MDRQWVVLVRPAEQETDHSTPKSYIGRGAFRSPSFARGGSIESLPLSYSQMAAARLDGVVRCKTRSSNVSPSSTLLGEEDCASVLTSHFSVCRGTGPTRP